MNLRYGWWLACALLCVSALGVQRVRADEIGAGSSPSPWTPSAGPPRPAAGGASALLPTARGRHAPASVAEPLARGETLYRAGRVPEAQQAFEAVLAIDPGNPRAWLRIGNLKQSGGDDAGALEAYRSAAAAVARSDPESEARGKALLNLAQLAIDEASRAIDAVDALRLASLRESRDPVARRLGAQRHRLRRSAERAGIDAVPVAAQAAGGSGEASDGDAAP